MCHYKYIHVVGAKEIKLRMTWNCHILANNIYWAAHVCFDLWTCQGLFPSQRLCQVQCNTLFAGDRDIANSISHGATCMMHLRLNRYFSNLPLFGSRKSFVEEYELLTSWLQILCLTSKTFRYLAVMSNDWNLHKFDKWCECLFTSPQNSHSKSISINSPL